LILSESLALFLNADIQLQPPIKFDENPQAIFKFRLQSNVEKFRSGIQ
jgi:hypothetical protein